MTEESTPTEKRDPNNFDTLLERVPELEERLKVKFESLSAVYARSGRMLNIFCEIHSETGCRLKCDIDFLAVVYDENDRIVAKEDKFIHKEEFYSFEVVQIVFFDLTPKKMSNIKKIKVYPSMW